MEDKTMDLITMQFQSINAQFLQVNEKLDKLTELTQQTNVQEQKIQQLEAQFAGIQKQLEKQQDKKSDTFWKVTSPLLSAFLSAVVAFIISGGLAK